MSAETREHVGSKWTWYALAAGIVWWAVHISGMAILVPYVCESQNQVWFHLLTAVTGLLTLHAVWPAWTAWQSHEGEGGLQFIGAMGVLLNIIFLVAIIAEWIPIFFIDACAG